MRQFLKQNRTQLDQAIRRRLNRPDVKLNDEERRQWVLNDEGLYSWSRSEGVPV